MSATQYFDELPKWKQNGTDPYVKEGPFLWSGKKPPPNIGERVFIRMNGFGWAKVLRYFVEHGYLGIYTQVEKVPDWFWKQNETTRCHFFGIDIGDAPPKGK